VTVVSLFDGRNEKLNLSLHGARVEDSNGDGRSEVRKMPVRLNDLTLHAAIVSRRRSSRDWLFQPPSSAPSLPAQPSASVIEADRLESQRLGGWSRFL
jgi:hypothetical protein